MTEYTELLMAALNTARKCYILEPTKRGKKEWLHLINVCKKELNECKIGVIQ